MQQFGTDKDLKKLIRKAQKQGWTVEYDGQQHIKVFPLSAPVFSIPLSPGSRMRVTRAKIQFRKAGLE